MTDSALDIADQGRNLHDWLDGQPSRPKWPVVRAVIASLLDVLETQHRERGAHGAISPFAISIDRLQPLHVELAPPRPDLPDANAEPLPPSYLAPELRGGEGAPTVSSDMYGVAAVAYRMVTGRAPETIAAGHEWPITGAASHLAAEDYPIEFLSAVDTTLASDPTERPGIAVWRARAIAPAVDEASTRVGLLHNHSDGTVARPRSEAVPLDHGRTWDPSMRRLLFALAAGTTLAGLIGVWLLAQVAGIVVPVTRTVAPNRAPIVSPPSGASDVGKKVLVEAPRPAAPAVTPPPGAVDGVTEPARPAPSPTLAQPTHLRDCDACPEMIVVNPGTVRMRLVLPSATTPQEISVIVDRPFAVGRFELTRAEFAAFVEIAGFTPSPGCYVRRPDWRLDERLSWTAPGFAQDDRHPVTCLSFEDATAYVSWLSRRTGKSYRLLTDAEWHLIASGADRPTAGSGEQCRFANGADETALLAEPKWNTARCRDGYHHTAPVGTFASVGQGFGDLFGNLWEWVDSCAPDFSGPSPVFGTCAADAPRILRGGSWSSEPAMVSLDARILSAPHVRDQTIGVRIARDVSPCEATGEDCGTSAAAPGDGIKAAAAPIRADLGREAAGEVATVRGPASASFGGQDRVLAATSPLFVGDLIRTGEAARATLRLGKRTVLRLGERTEIRLDRYVVDAGGEFDLKSGAIQFERTGTPSASPFAIRSEYGLIAVRGTRFFAGPSRGAFAVLVGSGKVAVTSGGQTVIVGPQLGTEIAQPDAPPDPPKAWKYERMREALDLVR